MAYLVIALDKACVNSEICVENTIKEAKEVAIELTDNSNILEKFFIIDLVKYSLVSSGFVPLRKSIVWTDKT